MKSFVRMTLALTVALSLSGPVLAESEFTLAQSEVNLRLVGNQSVSGQVESIDGSIVMIKTNDGGMQTFQVDPRVISSLKLDQGATVSINTSQIQTGRVVGLDRYTIKVKQDSGTTQTYIFPRERRRTLSFGNRVVISGQQISRAEDFLLTASQVRLNQVIATSASGPLTSRTSVEKTTEITTTDPAYTSPVGGYTGEEAVPALW